MMLIHYSSSGGFANLRLTYSVDTTKLPQELAQELERLVNQTKFFTLQAAPAISAAGGLPDMMQYEISIQQGEERRSLHYNDMTMPEQLRSLQERLQELALEQRSQS
ncbi:MULTISPECIES: protealysin inhibitor emfourin [unclassified Leptolyngbya]|uniref:protealysin inhibitor emfourin n=1 Tax=unclassified Leptolyngbya TaxID=2650499 RepID=UPI00168754F7|nr:MULTISPECIES: protealysin inhibitor emfourin [unclassified Leptolyngbya]MBD1911401.1 hypothetical protein [Leptolyngbya sp. FACHB-8]MBD2159027.1 hypothetical protein [Leptolyngbya sp. FACHB-16]